MQVFTLRAVSARTEVWVSNNLNYPTGDCRNDGARNVITDAQATYLSNEFSDQMYPKMTANFSSPPPRDGTGATAAGAHRPAADLLPGPGSKIVTLVANFRDENFTDITFPSYVAGYHSSDINAFVNRNVMSIDSYDWLHRTGANPPNEPSTVLCDNRPGLPFRYEGIFAHEYQHLLEFWASPGEATWVNEGLSDYAITVTGYGFPRRTIEEFAWDGHIQTFLGWRTVVTPFNQIPQPNGGAENSLTIWEDQGDLETLADYGAAWTFMEFLHSRYGPAFMTDFHNEDVNGLEGLQVLLDRYVTGTTDPRVDPQVGRDGCRRPLDRRRREAARRHAGGGLPGGRALLRRQLGEPAELLDGRRAAERLGLRPAAGWFGQPPERGGDLVALVLGADAPHAAADGVDVRGSGR